MGVVLNREADVTVGEAVPDLAYLAEPDDSGPRRRPRVGEPVTVLATSTDPEHAALLSTRRRLRAGGGGRRAEDLVGGRAPLARLRRARRLGPRPARGRDGGGVLDRRGSRSPRTSSRSDPEGLWSSVLRRKGGEYVVIATMPADPTLN